MTNARGPRDRRSGDQRMGTRAVALVALVALALPVGAATSASAAGLGGDGAPSATPATTPSTTTTSPLPPATRPSTNPATRPGSNGSRPGLAVPGTPDFGTFGAPSAGPTAAVPTLVVTPSQNLASGQVVTVTGTGYTPGTPGSPGGPGGLALVECKAPATGFEQCAGGDSVVPNAAGAISQPFHVIRNLRLGTGNVQCDTAPGACVIAVVDFFGAAALASAPISFDATIPRPHPSIAVTPSTGLRAGQSVSVHGTGFAAGGLVSVGECAVGARFCDAAFSGHETPVAGNGTFTISLNASLRINDDNGDLTHCLAVACEIQAADFENADYFAAAPIGFDPSQPLPATPAITVTPHVGLHHNQAVVVAGTGFDPNAEVQVSQCPPNAPGFCGDTLGSTTAGADGTFSTSVNVSRLVSSFDFSGGTPTTSVVDCAGKACTLSANEFSDAGFDLTAGAPIAFDASIPAPALPVVTVVPKDKLPYRANLTVHGTGYSPGEQVYGEFCANGASFGSCSFGFGAAGPATADASGAVTFNLPVRRINSGIPEEGIAPIDCVDPQVECSVTIIGEHSYEQTKVVLTFDPNAPIPPPPTATATPNTNLDYRQSVAIDGSGFLPGPVAIAECGGDESGGLAGLLGGCTGYTELTADAGGHLSGSFGARRVIGSGFAPPVDCGSPTASCFLRVGGFEPNEFVDVPLGFDPNSVVPPPPTVRVSPHSRLHHGDVVDVEGARFTPNADLAVIECRSGAFPIAACDFSSFGFVVADANGRFATTATVHSTFTTFNGSGAALASQAFRGPTPAPLRGPFGGSIDCGAAPGTCVLNVVNVSDLLEQGSAPLSFDVPELDVHGVTVREGTGGVTPAPVTVELSKPTNQPVVVHWKTVDGTAVGGQDYTAAEGDVMIAAGDTTATIPTDVIGDAVDERTERFRVEITSAPGAAIEDHSATVKIKDDDREPDVSIGDATVVEGDTGTGAVDVPVTLSGPSGRAVSVEYRTHHRSARSGKDFVRARGEVVIAAGATQGVIRLAIIGDRVREHTETFRVEVDDANHAHITHRAATVTIIDND